MRHSAGLLLVFLICRPAGAEAFRYRDPLLGVLVKQVPGILESFDASTGRFGEGIWIVRDQHAMYPLAVAYAYRDEANPYYKDAKLLDVIVRSGYALIEDADENGQWVFRKKDGSTWGNIWMPWTYSRWARTFRLIHEDMKPEDRQAWADALTLGYEGISRRNLGRVHNIPAHHAMGLYAAGQILNRPEWCRQAADFLMRVIDEQSDSGYWSENVGPVVGYNFVYTDALGTYYGMSGDRRVLEALQRAAAFHRHFTYPGGQRVETIDERNPYKAGIDVGNVGFTWTATGRAYLRTQWSRYGRKKLPADLIASLLLFGKEGPIEAETASQAGDRFVLTEEAQPRAATLRRDPWFVCLSGYTAPVPTSRWIQDRQNLLSIYHEKAGLLVGGGNTKLQPAWSTFTVGDTSLLKHTPGDTSPNFKPTGELYHVPSAAKLVTNETLGLDLTYGPMTCRVRVEVRSENVMRLTLEADGDFKLPVAAHLTLLPRLGETLKTGDGEAVELSRESFSVSSSQVGGRIHYAGAEFAVPETASLHWPALPHNPYRKDGRATAGEGRIEIRIPFDRHSRRQSVDIAVAN